MGLFTGDFYSESLAMTTQLRVIFRNCPMM